MALYPPIIDTSSAIQTGSGPFTVSYSLEGDSIPTHIAVTAVHPRTGASVLTTSSAPTTIVNSYDVAVTIEENKPSPIQVYIHQSVNIAQITLQGKIKNNDETTESSISSKAVIFKRFNENLTLSFIENKVISSSPYYLRAHLNIEGADDELAWYKIVLKSGSNILLRTDKLYPKAKNMIEEYINYDFWFHTNPAFTFDIEVGTRNGIVHTFNSNGSWTLNSIVSIPSTKKGTVSCSFAASNNLTTIWDSGSEKFPASQGYAALLYRQEGLNWILINTQSAAASDKQRSSLTFNFTITHTRAAQYRIVYKNTTLTEVQNVSNTFWYSAYGEDILLKDSTGSYLIKYNPELNSVKRNITDVITPTLGSKYPFVFRNGHQNYRTFSIGGLIARTDSDVNKAYYGTNEDILQERLLREELLDFLYNDKVKLFSSAQEGEMLIRLSGVSVTPMKQLGRMLYSFSATATEIADCTEENLEAFGIEG